MADVLAAVTVDLAYALHNLVLEVNRRIDAADALPQTATRCSRLLDQVDGMLDGLNIEDKRIRVILESIKSCVEELNDLLDKLMKMSDVHAEKGGGLCLCLKLASKGKDVLDAEKELEKTEDGEKGRARARTSSWRHLRVYPEWTTPCASRGAESCGTTARRTHPCSPRTSVVV